MLPIVTIIGRPNVGKSTLFNCLTNTKAALVFDLPGTTRDRNYGVGKLEQGSYILVDTAGIDEDFNKDLLISKQVKTAINEANLILLVVDAKAGLVADDLVLAKQLRKFSKKIILVINKIDGVNIDAVKLDFFALGFENIILLAARTNRGINNLKSQIQDHWIQTRSLLDNGSSELIINNNENNKIKVAIVGQPNVGKSTLINTILGEERVVVFDSPGTTRDSIYIPTKIGRQEYLLIDTAGVRRKAKIKQTLEKFSVIKTLQAINDAQVVLLLLDATKGVVEQDLKLIDFVINAGRSLVIAFNKWDLIQINEQQKLTKKLKAQLGFVDFIEPISISALQATKIKKIFTAIVKAHNSATLDVPTNKLSLLLEQAIAEHQPPLSKGRRIKLRYAHLGGHLPFKIIIHGTQVDSLPLSYKKYLSNFYREKLQLEGTVVHIVTKNTDNPYVTNKSHKK